MGWLTDNIEIIVVALVVMIIIQWIMMMTIGGKLKKLRKSYLAMMAGTDVENLEGVITSLQEKQQEQHIQLEQQSSRIGQIEKRIPQLKSNVTMKRYNAFANAGSDLSFSVAILNDERDGVVISSIHSREGAYMYGKPVEKGESKYSLTPEEKEVIQSTK